MRKILLAFSFLFMFTVTSSADTVSWDSIVSADDVTIAWLNGFKNTVVDALNSFPGENIETGSTPATAMNANGNIITRWDESFNDYVYSGLLPQTGTRAAATITAGTAYIGGTRVVKDETIPGTTAYPATSYIYVDLSNNGTYTYSPSVIGGAVPPVAANSTRLARVTTNATDVTAVRDDRVTSISLNIEEFLKRGFSIFYGSTTTVTVDAGIANAGTLKISKLSLTPLNTASATDYITGVSEAGASKALYVYLSPSGDVKFDDNAPDYHDTQGNTVGQLYYYKYTVGTTSTYWRCLGYVYLNAASLIVPNHVSSLALGEKIIQCLVTEDGELKLGTTAMVGDDTGPEITEGDEYMNLTIVPSSANSKLKIEVVFMGSHTVDQNTTVALFMDNVTNALAAGLKRQSSTYPIPMAFTHYMTAPNATPHIFRVRSGCTTGATTTFNGVSGARFFGGKSASSITITEYSP